MTSSLFFTRHRAVELAMQIMAAEVTQGARRAARIDMARDDLLALLAALPVGATGKPRDALRVTISGAVCAAASTAETQDQFADAVIDAMLDAVLPHEAGA